MTKSVVSMSFLAMSVMTFAMLTWKAPHLNLLGRIMSGEFMTDSAPVTEMPAPSPQDATAPLHLGSLSLSVPITLLSSIVRSEDDTQMRMEDDRLRCLLFAPPQDQLPDAYAMAGAARSHLPSSAVDVRAAAYRASTHDLSFWMSIDEVLLLEALLEIKPGTCPGAEHVELIHTDHVRGLLAFRDDEEKTRIIFDYFSPDERQCGMALFTVARGDESAINRVRAIVASFRVTPS